MKHLAVIPARSGSKGIKDKNIKLLCGKPLLQYSIEAAKDSGLFDEIMVSTDSKIYAEIALKCGANVPFLRSEETSGDKASSWDTVREVLLNYSKLKYEFETVALLQPTSPLRTGRDIKNAYKVFEAKNADAVVAVCEAEHSPVLFNTLPASGCMEGFIKHTQFDLPRQSNPQFYRINGAIYIRMAQDILQMRNLYNSKCYAYIMQQERAVDIDSQFDFEIAAFIMKN